MLTPAFSIGVSGLKMANTVTSMLSQNIANIDTPGYRRHENHNFEINFSGPDNKPYLPSGVGTTISSNDYPWLDRRYGDAMTDKAEKDAIVDGVNAIENITSDSTLSEAFTSFMNASQDLMANPNDQIIKENFNLTGENFVKQLNRVDGEFESVKSTIQEKIDLNTIRLNALTDTVEKLTTQPNTETVVSEMNFLKQQIAQVTGSISGYNRVLSKIIPPITGVYDQAKQEVISGTNSSYDQDLITDQYTWNRVPFGDINSLVEFGSQKFNKDLGRLATIAGSLQEAAEVDSAFGSSTLESVQSEFDAAYKVDLEDQAVKLLQYQRIYEANLKVIQTADNMIGSLLNIFD